MTPTYRPAPTRLACALNTHADAIATVAIALLVLVCVAVALVCHPALYLVP
jgi:hypothetical protein